MHGPADLVARHLREVQRLGDDALPGERGVAVDQDREHLFALGVLGPVALGAGHALDDGVDGLEVAGVRGERDGDLFAARRGVQTSRAEVVLHVARALYGRRVELALELAEDLPVRLPDDVREHVEPTAVRHADHDLAHTGVGRGRQQRVEHRDQGLGPFEAEALLAEVLRVEEALEGLGRVEPLEDAPLVRRLRRRRRRLDVALDPLLLVGLLDVHVLDADGAGVRVAQDAEDVAERHGPSRAGCRPAPRADRELAVEVPDR